MDISAMKGGELNLFRRILRRGREEQEAHFFQAVTHGLSAHPEIMKCPGRGGL
jgi:hypothetical protein